MNIKQMKEITKISKQFARGFKSRFPSINGSTWFIVDPLSGYLNSIGYENTAMNLPETKDHCQVLFLEFKDGSKLVPAGEDLIKIDPSCKNWMWI